jgi:opacity protein-like surface antigen
MRKDLSMAWVLLAAAMWVTLFSPSVLASGPGMDLYLTSLRWSSVNSEGNGKTARISSETLVGPALGLRLHKHLNLITEVMFGNPDASVTPGPTNKADVMVVNVGLDGYIRHFDVSCGTLAPYLTGGLGAINFDQDSAGGFDEWPFSYNMGGGLRWDMSGHTFFKFYYRWLWANLKVTDQTELFHGYGVSFGFTF